MCCKTDPEEQARRRMMAAFDRCGRGTCCQVSRWHHPGCPRRAEWLRERQAPGPRRQVGVEPISEIGGRGGLAWMVGGWATAVLLAGALSWWVVYR